MATIMHVDMDAFFAAVEILDHPEYVGKPLIIGGPRDAKRGVVSTCSYEARKFGVHSAMPLSKALALCPQGIFIPGRMARYQEVSAQIHNIFPEFSPLVEPLSVDEAFLDMTGCEHFYSDLPSMGMALKRRIKDEVGLTASVGIAPNKFLAKLASDHRKPDGLMVIRPDQVDDFLLPLPVSAIWGVGKQSEKALKQLGIYRIADLRKYSEEWLCRHFGSFGTHLYQLCRGIDNRPVESGQEVKSIGQETTFQEDYTDREFLTHHLAHLSEKVGWRLRRHHLFAKTITIKVRFADFRTITRAHSLVTPTHDNDTIFEAANDLFRRIPTQPIRLLGVTASNFTSNRQLSLFEKEQRSEKISHLLDEINAKYEDIAVAKGRTFRLKKKGPSES